MVYLIINKSQNTCKIGHSGNPQKRLSDLQVSNSDYLELLFVKEGNQKEESELHEKYKEFLIRGEWFKYVPQMAIDFIGGTFEPNVNYVRCYIKNLKRDKVKINKTESLILILLQLELKYSSSFIRIYSTLVKKFAKELELTTQSIYNAINGLIDMKVLILIDEDNFHLNPVYYWNGPENKRDLELKMINEKLTASK